MSHKLEDLLKSKNNQVDILLSTYNGSKYLHELIKSIINQTYQNWQILIRDDGSTDNTLEVILYYLNQFPNKIIYIDDQFNHLGPSQSFSTLMEYSNADFIMFCDQDDVWLDRKVELTVEKMLQLEKQYPRKPLLVHTDLTVVDKDLQIISDSFWKYQNLDPTYTGLNYLLIQNIVTGCTMMINKQLKELTNPIPEDAIMHDWWIALVASIYDGIHHINEPTILYRQHGDNNIGAKRYSFHYLLTRFGMVVESIRKIIKQGEQLCVIYRNHLNNDQTKLVECFIHLFHKNRLTRLIDMFIYRFRKHGMIRNIGFFLTMMDLNDKKISKK